MIYENMTILTEKINKLCAEKQPFFLAVNYEQTEAYLVENPLSQQEVFFKFPTAENKKESFLPEKIDFAAVSENFEKYKEKFDKLQEHLKKNEILLANLTEKTQISTNLSLEQIFDLSQSPYQIFIPEKFVCFSPERFVKIADGKISANPMKGTIDADIENAEEIITDNPKEKYEHEETVNLLCEELRQVAENVEITRFRYCEKISTNGKNLLQTSSEITGKLSGDYMKNMGNIIFSLLPAVSIAGNPKQKSIEILHGIEGENRGFYCGIAGFFDGKEFDSAVLIRFIEQDSGKLFFRSGGGITEKSICEKEYQEVLSKIYLPFCSKNLNVAAQPFFVETIKIENGEIFNLDYHQERMQKTAMFFYGTKPKIEIDISEIPPNLRNKKVKCRVLYNSEITDIEFHEYKAKKIRKLRVVEDNDINYSHKSLDRTEIDDLFEQRFGADDIIIAKNGKICDSSFANLVFETFDGQFFTPKTYLLEGTKRKFLLENGIIKEEDITINDIAFYEKVYFINAMIDIEDKICVPTSQILF